MARILLIYVGVDDVHVDDVGVDNVDVLVESLSSRSHGLYRA
jgi:hypothetical protein